MSLYPLHSRNKDEYDKVNFLFENEYRTIKLIFVPLLFLIRGGNVGRPDPFRPSLRKARTAQAGPRHPAYFMQAENIGPPRIPLGLQAREPARLFFNFFF